MGGLTSLYRAYVRLDKLLAMYLLKEERKSTLLSIEDCFNRMFTAVVSDRGDQQPEQEPEFDPEFSYLGRSLSRSRSGKFFKKPDKEPEPELCYGSFSFKLSFAYVRKIEQNSI